MERPVSGYVGYEEGGRLTEKVHNRSLLCSPLWRGGRSSPWYFQCASPNPRAAEVPAAVGDAGGFLNTIIVWPSNLGATSCGMKKRRSVFGARDARFDQKAWKSGWWKGSRESYRPEFINRIDEKVVSIVWLARVCALEVVQKLWVKPLIVSLAEKRVSLFPTWYGLWPEMGSSSIASNSTNSGEGHL